MVIFLNIEGAFQGSVHVDDSGIVGTSRVKPQVFKLFEQTVERRAIRGGNLGEVLHLEPNPRMLSATLRFLRKFPFCGMLPSRR